MHIELHTAAREAAALQLRCRRVEDRQPGPGGRLAFDVLPSQKKVFFPRFSRVGCHINCPQLYHLLRETDYGHCPTLEDWFLLEDYDLFPK